MAVPLALLFKENTKGCTWIYREERCKNPREILLIFIQICPLSSAIYRKGEDINIPITARRQNYDELFK